MGFFTIETLEDKFIKAINQTDGKWAVTNDWRNSTVVFVSKEGNISLSFFFKHDSYFPQAFQIIDGHRKHIDQNLYDRIYRLAQDKILQQEISKLGGYILDDDLAQAIKDTKTVLSARGQVIGLTELIQKIREKYHK